MLDLKILRSDLESTFAALRRRGFDLDVEKWSRLESQRKKLQIATEELQAERNKRSKEIGNAKAKGIDTKDILSSMEDLSDSLKESVQSLELVKKELHEFLLGLPNIPDETVPYGSSENDNVELRVVGSPRVFNFDVKDHVEIGESLGQMDFESASKLSGSRFVVLSGDIARLQRALIQFMLDLHVSEHQYKEVYVPFLVNEDTMIGTGQLPKFKEDLFSINLQELYLIPTAEVPVTGLMKNSIIGKESLPIRYVCHSPCFRSEAGSYGKDTRGMIRQHQFEKVELVQFVSPESSRNCLEQLTADAEVVLQRLELPYRVVELCTGDLGFSAAKTYDLEVWLPSQNTYREISSCSNFREFQARRMKARWRNSETSKVELLHTLNGSGVAAGRALIAVLENFQRQDGSVEIPKVLRPYMAGQEELSSAGS
ncbi:MAG: serine--tRNA ligase [Pseudomonadota bacterium]|nr:serine--tRNA ligase [Pseudomonadota bacterium]